MKNPYTFNGDRLACDLRVELHPATAAWMSGARYGTVIKLGRTLVHVRLDADSSIRRFIPSNIGRVIGRRN